MSKTFRARRDSWDDEDDIDFRSSKNDRKAKKAERRERKIRHEMKADDQVRHNSFLNASFDDD